jgi:hypothetical protein
LVCVGYIRTVININIDIDIAINIGTGIDIYININIDIDIFTTSIVYSTSISLVKWKRNEASGLVDKLLDPCGICWVHLLNILRDLDGNTGLVPVVSVWVFSLR